MSQLTFEELRHANLMHPHDKDKHEFKAPLAVLEQLDDEMLARALAEMVIQADWLAAARGIDLALTIRNVFATGESLDDLKRRRIDDVERKFASP